MMKVLLAIPAYNCEKQITRVISSLNDELLNKLIKVIIIDNQSKDKTLEKSLEMASKLKNQKLEVWQNSENYGLGGTHKVALLHAEKIGADYLAILHGDNQAKTAELSQLLEIAAKNPESSAILGSRFLKNSKLNGYSTSRIWGNRLLNLIFTVITFRPVKDLGSGLNLFRLKDLQDHNYLSFNDNMTFNIDLLLDYIKKGSKLIYFPITWSETDQVSNARNFNVALTALRNLISWRLGSRKILDRQASYYKSSRIEHA